ncbi:YfaP family protein [Fibrella sp. WM1]|uniref:YfaP family protein n=1 Tax=Fibrella musci TaxID=3242485 RepID=UPI003520806C
MLNHSIIGAANRFWLVVFAISLTLLAGSCKKPADVLPAEIDPANASLLSQVLIMPSGTQTQAGDAPSPTTGSGAPVVNSPYTTVISSNGSTAPLTYSYRNVSGNLAGCYVQVVGADRYFRIPYASNSSASGRLSLPVGIPTNVLDGQFTLAFCVYDANGRVSAPVTVTINVLRLGTGAVQVSLSWDDDTDQDLYVTDPANEIISYKNTSSSSGGALDRDDTSGYGPENIFWTQNAPDGRYQVRVNAYSAASQTNFYVTVSYPGGSKSFTGITSFNARTANVTTFTKSGSTITF